MIQILKYWGLTGHLRKPAYLDKGSLPVMPSLSWALVSPQGLYWRGSLWSEVQATNLSFQPSVQRQLLSSRVWIHMENTAWMSTKTKPRAFLSVSSIKESNTKLPILWALARTLTASYQWWLLSTSKHQDFSSSRQNPAFPRQFLMLCGGYIVSLGGEKNISNFKKKKIWSRIYCNLEK